MSKKKGQAKKRRKRLLKTVRCVNCHVVIDTSPIRHLSSIADLLNLAEQAEDKRMKIRFRHGAAFSEVGVVVPPYKGLPWEAKPFNLNGPSSPEADASGDGMED